VSFAPKFLLSIIILGVIWCVACGQRGSQLPVYDNVPAFTMTASDGRIFDSKQLTGKVWIADFIYTNCPGPCPRMTSQMHRLQLQLKDDPDVRLVSISVDPHRDTPVVLNAYAKHFGGPTGDWVFLTGSDATTHLLAHDVFKVGDLINVMDHSTRFILVDKRGTIRGYYSTFDKEDMQKLMQDAESLR
jgi:protein SCO1/2